MEAFTGDTASGIVLAAAVFSALATLFGAAFAVYKWYLKQEKQDKDIAKMKEENELTFCALIACLDGLEQLGANHAVSETKEKLEGYINRQAHK